MNKTALKLGILLLGVVVLLVGAFVHNRFLYTKATTEPIYPSPLNLQSPHTKEQIKQSSYISLEKLQRAIESKQDPSQDPDAVFEADFPRQELYPILRQNPSLPQFLAKFEQFLPETARLHLLLYRDLACSDVFCSLQKYAVIFPLFVIFVGVCVFAYEHKNSYSHKKLLYLFVGATMCLLIVFAVFFAASLAVVLQLKARGLIDLQQAVTQLNSQTSDNAGNRNFYTSRDAIAVYLTVTKKTPTIFEPHNKQEIAAIYLYDEQEPVTFYEKYILLNTIIEKDFITETIKPSIFLFDDSKLVIYKYTKDDLAILMPVLSKNIINKEFGAFNPKVTRDISFKVLDQLEYQAFQEKKEEEFKAEVKNYISQVQAEIQKVNTAVAQGKSYIKDIDAYMTEVDELYKTHVKEPQEEYDTYCKGEYKDYPECKYLKSIIDTNKKRLQEAEATLEAEKKKIEDFEQDAEKVNSELQAQLTELNGVLKLISDNPINTESQKGVFFPGEMGIKLRYFDADSEDIFQERIADKEAKSISPQTKLAYDYILNGYSQKPTFSQYLITSLHEYLHAIAYYENYQWPDSLEEALTEYLAFEAGFEYVYDKSKLDRLVYTDNVQMIEKLISNLDETKLIELYFNDKTDKSLRNEFARVYSAYNYDTFTKDFDTLLYMNYDDFKARQDFVEKMEKNLNRTESL